jgi:hypothetical protein
MSQRTSGFERRPGDQYMTPPWVVETLMAVMSVWGNVWEPAAGEGAIVETIRARAGRWAKVHGTDIDPAFKWPVQDFLHEHSHAHMPTEGPFWIITNPPYGPQGRLAEAFTRRAVSYTQLNGGSAAMLLPVDWDAGKTRHDLFENFPGHVTKITLTERIRWTNLPQSKSGPSQNHAWFIWDHGRKGRDMRWLGRVTA